MRREDELKEREREVGMRGREESVREGWGRKGKGGGVREGEEGELELEVGRERTPLWKGASLQISEYGVLQ